MRHKVKIEKIVTSNQILEYQIYLNGNCVGMVYPQQDKYGEWGGTLSNLNFNSLIGSGFYSYGKKTAFAVVKELVASFKDSLI